MLEAIGAGDPNYKGKDWGDVWAKSPENEKLGHEIQDIVADRRGASNDQGKDDRQYAMPLTTQMYAVIHRSFVAMWRDPQYVTGVVLLHVITGLFNSFTFWNLGNSQIDMQSRLFSMTLTIAPPLIQQLQPRFLHFRDLYESREGSAKIYSWPAMVWGAILSEIPYRIIAGTIYCKSFFKDCPSGLLTRSRVLLVLGRGIPKRYLYLRKCLAFRDII
jgi:ATP-binding cassette subfamily G (WHITE) protein 2 (SNQ2)